MPVRRVSGVRGSGDRLTYETQEAILGRILENGFSFVLSIDVVFMTCVAHVGTRAAWQGKDYAAGFAAQAALLSEESRAQFEDLFEPKKVRSGAVIRCGFLVAVEVALAGGGGWEEWSLYYGFDAAGRQVAVVTVRDVTAQRQARALSHATPLRTGRRS